MPTGEGNGYFLVESSEGNAQRRVSKCRTQTVIQVDMKLRRQKAAAEEVEKIGRRVEDVVKFPVTDYREDMNVMTLSV